LPVSKPATVSHLAGNLTARAKALLSAVSAPNGAFAEYIVAESERGIVPKPSTWSFEQASQLGIAPFTALQCLHETLEVPSPFDARSGPQRSILIWGGASSVGQYAIQFAKLGGFKVITTASPKNFNLVKDLGADEVFEYGDENVVEKIRAYTGNTLEIAIDTISEGKTPKQVTGAIGDKGGKVAIILPYESPRPDVEVKFSMVFALLKRVHSLPLSMRLLSHELLGVEGQVVCRFVYQDPCHGQDQAEPSLSPSRRPGQCQGRPPVHATGQGN
jgi:NADPH:quinone reductase-like Zn-dependent oxidoreductase